jgi:hypothetical protein
VVFFHVNRTYVPTSFVLPLHSPLYVRFSRGFLRYSSHVYKDDAFRLENVFLFSSSHSSDPKRSLSTTSLARTQPCQPLCPALIVHSSIRYCPPPSSRLCPCLPLRLCFCLRPCHLLPSPRGLDLSRLTLFPFTLIAESFSAVELTRTYLRIVPKRELFWRANSRFGGSVYGSPRIIHCDSEMLPVVLHTSSLTVARLFSGEGFWHEVERNGARVWHRKSTWQSL